MANDIEELRFNGTRYGINDERLASKANIDGAYEGMTVGNAEQLVGTTFEEDSVPYNFRTSGGSIDIGDREYDELVGGTVAWNQQVPNGDFGSASGWSNAFTISDGVASTTYTSDGTYNSPISCSKTTVLGHIYLVHARYKCTVSNRIRVRYPFVSTERLTTANTWEDFYWISVGTSNTDIGVQTDSINGATSSYKYIACYDLTQMFGSTIAGYINTLETANAGAGVAWFKKLFPKDYYAYNAGQLMSVKTSSHNTVGFNAWDEEWEVGSLDTDTGAPTTSDSTIRSKNFIPCVPGTTYYAKTAGVAMPLFFYDANKNYLSRVTKTNNTFTTPADAHFIKFRMATDYGTTYKNDICINLHWDGERDGDYEAYKKWTYPLDSDLELRGIPKLDASNNLYYDGDTYESDGTVNRRFGIVDLGTLTYTNYKTGGYNATLSPTPQQQPTGLTVPNAITSKYYEFVPTSATLETGQATITAGRIYIVDTAFSGYTGEQVASALNGVYMVYKLATPTTEEADPYQNPQIVDDFGTEEYVDTRDVAIPVGHNTKYQPNLRAKLEMLPNSPDGDGDYLMRQANGENSFVPFVKELPTLPSEDGTYVLKCTVSGSTKTLGWVEEE